MLPPGLVTEPLAGRPCGQAVPVRIVVCALSHSQRAPTWTWSQGVGRPSRARAAGCSRS